MVTTDDMLQAYYDCRKRKRRTASAVVYEMDYEARLIALRDRINTRQYAPGKSICFVVTRPRYRVSIHTPARGATLPPYYALGRLPEAFL